MFEDALMGPAPKMDSLLEMPAGSQNSAMKGILDGLGAGSVREETPATAKKLIISAGVMTGHQIFAPAPEYPTIAKATQIQGTVVLQAVISATGNIENLRVIIAFSQILWGGKVSYVRPFFDGTAA